MYSFKEYWNTKKDYKYRWNQSDRSFSRPEYQIATPLEQCYFVMTQLDEDKKPFPVDMWGCAIDPNIYGATDFFNNARPLWVDGQCSFYDGYSIVLPSEPNPVLVDDHEYYVVVGIYENCVSWSGKNFNLSIEFIADCMILGSPLMWFTPDRKGMCWAGLSATPIIGGACGSKRISSFNMLIPITSFFIREDAEPDSEDDFLTLLPENAAEVINKWFDVKELA